MTDCDPKSCHSEAVTSVFIDYPDNPVGSVITIDGQCYIKTGIEGSVTHTLSSAPVIETSCSSCLSAVSGAQ